MPLFDDIEDFAASLPPSGALIGLDLGTKTIGVAVSDLGRRIATPRLVVRRKKFAIDAEAVLAEGRAAGAVGIVIGLPLNMDGSAGPRVQATRAFAANLAGVADLPIAFWDERLSTVAVTRTLIEADRSRRRRAELVDKMAAAYILQGALDRLAT